MEIHPKTLIATLFVAILALTAWAGEKTKETTKVWAVDPLVLEAEKEEITLEELSKLPAPAAGKKKLKPKSS